HGDAAGEGHGGAPNERRAERGRDDSRGGKRGVRARGACRDERLHVRLEAQLLRAGECKDDSCAPRSSCCPGRGWRGCSRSARGVVWQAAREARGSSLAAGPRRHARRGGRRRSCGGGGGEGAAEDGDVAVRVVATVGVRVAVVVAVKGGEYGVEVDEGGGGAREG
ncbi:hypothetical protein C8J57DRAFT_1282115, partial [Mycena rebaudengoi]